MQEIKSYKDLIVWRKSLDVVHQIYVGTKLFPKDEMFGLTSQMRRCAVSIPSNIAEGYHRSSKKDYRNFLFMAYGSGAELETQLEIAKMEEYVSQEYFLRVQILLNEIMRMLNKMIHALQD